MNFRPAALHRVSVIAILGLLGFYPAGPAHAGDEEINPSVYQVFDPETGFFIDVEPPPDAQPAATTHTPSASTPPAAAAGTEPQTPAASAPVAAAPQTSAASTQPAGGLDPMVLAGGAVIVVALAGLALRKRKGAD